MPNEPALPRTQAATSVARVQSPERPGRELFWIALVTILLGLTRCVPAQRFIAEDLHVSDELEMTLSTLDRLAGVPPTSLNWPGTVQQMLCVPLLGLDYLVTSGLNVSPAGFVEWLGAGVRGGDAWRSIVPVVRCRPVRRADSGLVLRACRGAVTGAAVRARAAVQDRDTQCTLPPRAGLAPPRRSRNGTCDQTRR